MINGTEFVAQVQSRARTALAQKMPDEEFISELERLAFEAGVAIGATVSLEILTEQAKARHE